MLLNKYTSILFLVFLPFIGYSNSHSADFTNPEITKMLCRGLDSSAVKYVVSGRPAPYIISWFEEGSASLIGNTTLTNDIDSFNITGLSDAISYVVVIEDDMGNIDCQDTIMFNTIGVFIANIDIIDEPSCAGDSDGEATAPIQIGTQTVNNAEGLGYSFSWSSGDVTQTAIGLSAGNQTVLVTSPEGCTSFDSENMPEPGLLTVSSTFTSPSCPGGGDGEITLMPSGGTPSSGAFPYTIQWSNDPGQNMETQSNLSAGNYNATITDINGCQVFESVTLVDPAPVNIIGFVNASPSSCSQGVCDGAAEVQVSGGSDPGSGYTFLWDNGETTSQATALCEGWNVVSVSNAGCPPIIDSVFIDSPNDVVVTGIDSSDLSCFGIADGTIQVDANGGNGTYSYMWSDGMTGNVRTGLNAQTYSVTATDSNGCTSDEFSVTLDEPDSLELVVDLGGTLDPRCFDSDNGIIAVRWIRGGNMDTTPSYTWSSNTPGNPNANIATNLPPGTYEVTITDGRGCQDVAQHTLVAPPPLVGQMRSPVEPNCFGELTTITVDTARGGTGTTFTFSVDNGPQQQLGAVSQVLAGTHLVSVFDRNACRWDSTIIINQPDEVTVDIVDEVFVNLGDSIQLMPNVPSSILIDSIIWSPPGNLTCTNCLEPWVFPSQSALYQIEVVDINGCRGSDEVFVNLNRARNVYIPNAFSPNGDGVNDFFQLFTGLGVNQVNYLRIFDRWGSIVYEQENYLPGGGNDGWNGKFKGKDLSMGTFVYIAEVRFLDNSELIFRGSLSLVR